jgi:hypothetical protein
MKDSGSFAVDSETALNGFAQMSYPSSRSVDVGHKMRIGLLTVGL